MGHPLIYHGGGIDSWSIAGILAPIRMEPGRGGPGVDHFPFDGRSLSSSMLGWRVLSLLSTWLCVAPLNGSTQQFMHSAMPKTSNWLADVRGLATALIFDLARLLIYAQTTQIHAVKHDTRALRDSQARSLLDALFTVPCGVPVQV